ncbi:MAG: hypothetical protein ACE366_18415 [Bradymonadia bacterium]
MLRQIAGGGLVLCVIGWFAAEPVSLRILRRRTGERLGAELAERGYTDLQLGRWQPPSADYILRWAPISLKETEEVAVDLVCSPRGELPITLLFEARDVAPRGVEILTGLHAGAFETGDALFDQHFTARGDEHTLRALLSERIRKIMLEVADAFTLKNGVLTAEVHGSPLRKGQPIDRIGPLHLVANALRRAQRLEVAPLLHKTLEAEGHPVARALQLRSQQSMSGGAEHPMVSPHEAPWSVLALSTLLPGIEQRLEAILAVMEYVPEDALSEALPKLFWSAFDGAMAPSESAETRTQQHAVVEHLLEYGATRLGVVRKLFGLRPHYDALLRDALLLEGVASRALSERPPRGIPDLIATAPRSQAERVLFQLLEVEQGAVRSEATIALGSIGDQETLRKLEHMIEMHPTAGLDLRQALDLARKRVAGREVKARRVQREAATGQEGRLTIVEPASEGKLSLSAPDGALSREEDA